MDVLELNGGHVYCIACDAGPFGNTRCVQTHLAGKLHQKRAAASSDSGCLMPCGAACDEVRYSADMSSEEMEHLPEYVDVNCIKDGKLTCLLCNSFSSSTVAAMLFHLGSSTHANSCERLGYPQLVFNQTLHRVELKDSGLPVARSDDAQHVTAPRPPKSKASKSQHSPPQDSVKLKESGFPVAHTDDAERISASRPRKSKSSTRQHPSPTEAAPKCIDCSKVMNWTDYHSGNYADGWRCDNFAICKSCISSNGRYRWFCKDCQNDYCSICYAKDKENKENVQCTQRTLRVQDKEGNVGKNNTAATRSHSPPPSVGQIENSSSPGTSSTCSGGDVSSYDSSTSVPQDEPSAQNQDDDLKPLLARQAGNSAPSKEIVNHSTPADMQELYSLQPCRSLKESSSHVRLCGKEALLALLGQWCDISGSRYNVTPCDGAALTVATTRPNGQVKYSHGLIRQRSDGKVTWGSTESYHLEAFATSQQHELNLVEWVPRHQSCQPFTWKRVPSCDEAATFSSTDPAAKSLARRAAEPDMKGSDTVMDAATCSAVATEGQRDASHRVDPVEATGGMASGDIEAGAHVAVAEGDQAARIGASIGDGQRIGMQCGDVVVACMQVAKPLAGYGEENFLIPIEIGEAVTVAYIEDEWFWGIAGARQGWAPVAAF